jgi:diguanylate cyclase (GGDEF)-like protein
MAYKDTKTYQKLAEEHLESILSLADIDITKHIENTMTKPVMVSKTMANDSFLIQWLKKEPENNKDEAFLKQLYSYLKIYQEKNSYTTVFCISDKSGSYYYQDGLNKVISPTDEHDVWYYNFINSGHEYDLQVDTNEASGNHLTIFVNFRVENEEKELLGVIGVGLQIDLVEDTIRSYERDYGLSVYIVNERGAQNSFTGSTDIFINEAGLNERTGITDNILMNRSYEPQMQWFTTEGERKCLIMKYDQTLGWFLILEKDTSSISKVFQERIKSSVLFMLISLVICIMVTTIVFHIYNLKLISVENTDDLTGLSNSRLFEKQYISFINRNKDKKLSLFIFDLDHFKNINDEYGHVFGNAILTMVGERLKSTLNGQGIAARWGGDEFIGVIALDTLAANNVLKQYMDSLTIEEEGKLHKVTVSIGITELNRKLTMEQLIKKADEALYASKENGRNRITINS